jgi:hypothetical protein
MYCYWLILSTLQLLSSNLAAQPPQAHSFVVRAIPCYTINMPAWRQLLKPDWRRLVATMLMVALLVATYIQAFVFVDDVPGATKPPLYDALFPFDFWVPGMMLILPLALVAAPLQALGFYPLSSPLIWPLQIGYVYLLSCLLVFGHDDWARRIPLGWRRLLVILPALVAIVLWGSGMLGAIRSMPHMIPFFASSTLLSACVLSLYAYIAVCISLAVLKRRRR